MSDQISTITAHFSTIQRVIQNRIYFSCLQSRGQPAAPGATAPAKAGTFTTFNVPVPGAFGTHPTAINPARAIAGFYFDASGLEHSFLRTPNGNITPFDPPGATCSASTEVFVCSQPLGITPEGMVVGFYTDASFVSHGFLRAPDGAFTVFDPPGSISTFTAAVNPDGAVTGEFFVNPFLQHGFLRTRNGTFTVFDPPGSRSTFTAAINPAKAITGACFDTNFALHGFLRTPDGTITSFDPPGSTFTFPSAINPAVTSWSSL
jgi:hypothetical protein